MCAKLVRDRYPTGMPVDEAVRIVTAIATALDYAHQRGLLHRDVKPANIMMTHLDDEGEQRIVLTDFGIARNINDVSGLTKTNMTVGTVAYSAPEQLLGEDIDGRADQYSLAATAYQLLTGSQLFPNSNPAVIISRHLNSLPPALADARPELAVLDSVLARALAKDPDDRFPRCSDFARALSELVSERGSPSPDATTKGRRRPTNRIPPAGYKPPHRAVNSSRRLWLLVGTSLAVIVLASVITLASRPWERQSVPSSRESGPTTSMVQVPPPVTTTTAVQPPPPPVAPATTSATPVATNIVTAVAVDRNGQPANGYREEYNDYPGTLSVCEVSPAAVRRNRQDLWIGRVWAGRFMAVVDTRVVRR
jgi:serine/threonine protein kinase, bacterial